MKKILGIAMAALVLGIGFVGCDLSPVSINDEVTISLGDITSITAGSEHNVTATVKGNVAIDDITIRITNDANQNVTTSMFTISKQNFSYGTKEKIEVGNNKDMYIRVTPKTDACNGTYTLEMTATAGSAVSTQKDNFTVTGGQVCNGPSTGTPVDTATVIAGANSNATHGSSIDLDGGVAWKSGDAANNVSKIDLCYAYSGVNNVEKIGTPAWAKISDFAFARNWTNPPATKFYKVNMTAAEFNAITTKEDMPAFNESSATATSYNCATGDVFIVKTTENAIALIRIAEQVSGASGTITIKRIK